MLLSMPSPLSRSTTPSSAHIQVSMMGVKSFKRHDQPKKKDWCCDTSLNSFRLFVELHFFETGRSCTVSSSSNMTACDQHCPWSSVIIHARFLDFPSSACTLGFDLHDCHFLIHNCFVCRCCCGGSVVIGDGVSGIHAGQGSEEKAEPEATAPATLVARSMSRRMPNHSCPMCIHHDIQSNSYSFN